MCKKFLRLDAHAEYSTGDGVPRPTPERAVWDVGCNAQLQRAVWDVGCNESLQIDTGGELGWLAVMSHYRLTPVASWVGWL